MGMASVIYKKGAPDNFVWRRSRSGPRARPGSLRSTACRREFR